jgi:RNA recognition motif-containing protein
MKKMKTKPVKETLKESEEAEEENTAESTETAVESKDVKNIETPTNAETKDGKKKSTPGVLFLSRIPTKMNVRIIRDYFSKYGTVDRIYLEPKGNKAF